VTALDAARAVPIEVELNRRGIRLRSEGRKLVGPCPRCGGSDRFSIRPKKNVWHCRGCDRQGHSGDIVGLVEFLDGVSFKDAVKTLSGDYPRRETPPPSATVYARRPHDEGYEREQHRKAAWVWSQRRPASGTTVEKYLRNRGIACPLPATIGYLPPSSSYPPAMVAAYCIPGEGEPGIADAPRNVVSVHITKLLPDGSDRERGKGAKITLGRPLGRPIVLAPVNDLLGLAITEGIEDALTVHQATGLGAWAAGSAPFMQSIADSVPNYVECVTVFAHPEQRGQDDARRLAEAIAGRGTEVFVEGMIRMVP
jgi:hypothetical protein